MSADVKEKRERSVTEVWLVRHTAVDVPLGTCYGRSDVPLRDTFADEAAAVRDALRGTRFDEVWSSPLGRCVRLAEACGYGDAMRDERLLEIDFGEWEGLRFDEIEDPRLQLWYDDYLHARPTGGETFEEQCARVAEFLEELRTGSSCEVSAGQHYRARRNLSGEVREDVTRRTLIFTHGGVMVAAGVHAGLFEPEEAFSHIPPHGGIIKIYL